MSELAIALIGGGNIARAHVAAARESGGRVRIAAVVDPSERAREAVIRDTGAAGFSTIEALLDAPAAGAIRAAIVATPPSVRLPIAAALLGKNIAVLAEKPLAHTLADARMLSALATRHPHVVTAVGYCHRFTPAVVEMRRRIDAGDIGEVSRFENTFAAPLPAMRDHWMSDPAVSGGGSFIDTGCHSLDLFRFLLGEGEVASATFHHAWPGRGESSATVHLRGASGVAGVVQSGWLEPARFVLTIVGSAGSLHYDYDRPTALLHRRNVGEAQIVEVADHALRFANQLQAFADAVLTERSTSLATFPDGVAAAALVDAARAAAHNE